MPYRYGALVSSLELPSDGGGFEYRPRMWMPVLAKPSRDQPVNIAIMNFHMISFRCFSIARGTTFSTFSQVLDDSKIQTS